MQQEVRAIRVAVGHPNVVELIEIIEDDEKLLLVMQFFEHGRIIEW
jgi:hypothetical protein